MNNEKQEWQGIINFLKPPGMSSGGAVSFVRKTLGCKRVGHGGTLDPGAAGVLPILVGRATRLSDWMMAQKKTYIGEVVFGVATETLDSYGTVLARQECQIEKAQVEEILPRFLGKIAQTPPQYSAIKVKGVASYKKAYQGKEVVHQQRMVQIYDLALLGQTRKNAFLLQVTCGKGTYIRTLAQDLGRALGVPATLSFLLRASAGGMKIEDAITADEMQAKAQQGNFDFLLPAGEATALQALPKIELGGKYAFGLKNGQIIPGDAPEGWFRVFCDGEFYGLGQKKEDGFHLKLLLWVEDETK